MGRKRPHTSPALPKAEEQPQVTTNLRRSQRSAAKRTTYEDQLSHSEEGKTKVDVVPKLKSPYFDDKKEKSGLTPKLKVVSKYFVKNEEARDSPMAKKMRTENLKEEEKDSDKPSKKGTISKRRRSKANYVESDDEFVDPQDPEYKPESDDEAKKKKKEEKKRLRNGQRSSLSVRSPVLGKISNTKSNSESSNGVHKHKKKPELPSGEVANLLMLNEFKDDKSNVEKEESTESSDTSDSDSEDDFEDVEEDELEENRGSIRKHKANISSKGLDIRLGQAMKPKAVKKVSQVKMELDFARMELNRRLNAVQFQLHCIHSLCLIARMQYLNNLADEPEIRAIIISMEIDQLLPKKFNLTEKSLTDFLVKFASKYEFDPVVDAEADTELFTWETIIDFIVSSKKTSNSDIYTFVCFCVLKEMLRTKQLLDSIRLCYVLEPVNLKPDYVFAFKENDKKEDLMVAPTLITKRVNNERPYQKKKKPKINLFTFWFEVYVNKPQKRWLPIEPINSIIGSETDFEKSFDCPPPYILAVNQDNKLCEVTQRYFPEIYFQPKFRKIRAEDFLKDTLNKLGIQPKSEGELHDKQQLEEQSSQVSFPTTVAGFKDHPLFVLDRHLLKYEAIYPKDTPPLGEFRGDSIFPRKNVHITHSRDYWKREARTVREGEPPYKMSTARPKWDKNLRDYIRDLPQELFGFWQTDPYDPPEAKDGLVPRNEFGNVDLFKPEMCPKGCVHLRLSGLLKVANKLGIDCSPAVTGFDVKNRGTVPLLDGFVVCQEFEETLVHAWREEQQHREERERQRYLNRVFKNWKKLIGLARARIRIKERYKDGSDFA